MRVANAAGHFSPVWGIPKRLGNGTRVHSSTGAFGAHNCSIELEILFS